MSSGERLPLDHARKLVNEVIDLLRPGCQRIEIAGSVRREKPTVHDLELVAQPNGDALTLADELLGQGVFRKRHGWGDRAKYAVYAGQNVDIFISLPDRQFACTYWLRTGSSEANHLMVTQQYRGGILPDDLVFCAEQFWRLPASLATFNTEEVERCKRKGDFAPLGGEIVQTPTEADVFALAGLPFIPPKYRDERTYRALAGRRLVAFDDVANLWDAERQVWAIPELAYIGRAMPYERLPMTPWANPFKIARDTPDDRQQAIERYRQHITTRFREEPTLIDPLRGKVLVCWCSPKPCHGDVLLELLGQRAQDAAPLQSRLFGAAQMREMEARAAEFVEARSAPRAKPVEPSTWCSPWLSDDGRVWVHSGYGAWELRAPDDALARLTFERLAADEDFRKAQAWRLKMFLLERGRASEAALAALPQQADEVIYAISLWEPWALLLALGEKQNETRSWRPPQNAIGRRFVIHAAKTEKDPETGIRLETYARMEPFASVLRRHGYRGWADLPRGEAIGCARLIEDRPAEVVRGGLSDQEFAFGNYGDQRRAWQFAEFSLFREPVPYRGHQGIWRWDLPLPEVLTSTHMQKVEVM